MNPKVKLSIALIILTIALWRLVGCSGNQQDIAPVAFRHYEVLGWKAAEAASKGIPSGSGSVLLVVADTENEALKMQQTSFEKTAKSLGLDDIVVVLAQPNEWSPEVGWSPGLLQRIQSGGSPIRGVVSFVGTPPVQTLRQNNPPPVAPYFLTVLPSQKQLDAFFKAGLVTQAILPGSLAGAPSVTPSQSNEDWFQAYYQLVDSTTGSNPPADFSTGLEEEIQY